MIILPLAGVAAAGWLAARWVADNIVVQVGPGQLPVVFTEDDIAEPLGYDEEWNYLPDLPDGSLITDTVAIVHFLTRDGQQAYQMRWTGEASLSGKLGILTLASGDLRDQYRWGSAGAGTWQGSGDEDEEVDE